MTPPGRGTASGCALGAVYSPSADAGRPGHQRDQLPGDAARDWRTRDRRAMLNEPFLARAQRQGTICGRSSWTDVSEFTISSVIFAPQLYNDRPRPKGSSASFAPCGVLAARAGTPQRMTWTDVIETMARYTGRRGVAARPGRRASTRTVAEPGLAVYCYQSSAARGVITAAASEQTWPPSSASTWSTRACELGGCGELRAPGTAHGQRRAGR